ncbi:MAG: DUF4870 domain-containing protein [Anaerolineales bacterium]|nr:DUF4870 domain-containing protein [Anaerolineales bacterium]
MTEEPINAEPVFDITDDDKLWAMLSYVFSPLVPIIVLLMEDKKARPFIKYHSMQALAVGLINLVLGTVLSFTVVLACVPIFVWFALIYWGVKAYQGEQFEIPVVTSFMQGQGWM